MTVEGASLVETFGERERRTSCRTPAAAAARYVAAIRAKLPDGYTERSGRGSAS